MSLNILLEIVLDYFVIFFYEFVWWICIGFNEDVNCYKKFIVKLGYSCF